MAHRTFADTNGTTWEVWDVRPDTKPGHEAFSGVPVGGWLCFQSGSIRRRLMPIPPGWDRVADDQLLRFWHIAVPVAARSNGRAAAEIGHGNTADSQVGQELDPRD